MIIKTAVLAMLTCVPPLYAHGQEVIFVPVGQVAALIINGCLIVILFRRSNGLKRWYGALAMTLVIVVEWFLPGRYWPDWTRHTDSGYFLAGLLFPLGVGMAVNIIVRLIPVRTPSHQSEKKTVNKKLATRFLIVALISACIGQAIAHNVPRVPKCLARHLRRCRSANTVTDCMYAARPEGLSALPRYHVCKTPKFSIKMCLLL